MKKMFELNFEEVFTKIEGETQNSLNGEILENAMNFIAYLKKSGRTCMLPNGGHPEFYFTDELSCLIVYSKFVNDPSEWWNICCCQSINDVYEHDDFLVDESVKEFAQNKVWKCIGCNGCNAPGGRRRTVFGKVFDNACCNLWQFISPNADDLNKIIKFKITVLVM